jgi:hypothetical protein
MRPPWLATSTTTAPRWLRRRRTASASSPLSRCPTSMNPWPRPFTLSTTSRQTASCCWPTTMAPTSVRAARTTSGRRSMSARPRCSSIPPICPDRLCPAWRRGPQTFCSTPPAPHTYWCATAFAANMRTFGSSSAMPAASSRMPRPGWPWQSWPTRDEALPTASTTFPASTSTPHCRPVPPRCRRYWHSLNQPTSRSGPTFRTRPLPRASSSPRGWRPTGVWTPRSAMPSTAPTHLMLFPRLGATSAPPPVSRFDTARHIASRLAMRGVARLISAG